MKLKTAEGERDCAFGLRGRKWQETERRLSNGGSTWRQLIEFILQAQPSPPAPQPPEGIDDAFAAPAPTNPGLESSFARFTLWHFGQEGVRSWVTNASN